MGYVHLLIRNEFHDISSLPANLNDRIFPASLFMPKLARKDLFIDIKFVYFEPVDYNSVADIIIACSGSSLMIRPGMDVPENVYVLCNSGKGGARTVEHSNSMEDLANAVLHASIKDLKVNTNVKNEALSPAVAPRQLSRTFFRDLSQPNNTPYLNLAVPEKRLGPNVSAQKIPSLAIIDQEKSAQLNSARLESVMSLEKQSFTPTGLEKDIKIKVPVISPRPQKSSKVIPTAPKTSNNFNSAFGPPKRKNIAATYTPSCMNVSEPEEINKIESQYVPDTQTKEIKNCQELDINENLVNVVCAPLVVKNDRPMVKRFKKQIQIRNSGIVRTV